jgi:hypothetical protein
MNRIRHLSVTLAALAAALLGLSAGAPAAFASTNMLPAPVGGGPATGTPPATVTHTVIVGGMAGWQIAMIAVGAALLAAAAAVLLDRAWQARRQALSPAA